MPWRYILITHYIIHEAYVVMDTYIHTANSTHLFLSSSVPDLKENGILAYFYSFSGESCPGIEEKERRDK